VDTFDFFWVRSFYLFFQLRAKELSLCHKLWFSNHYIYKSQLLKYQTLKPPGCKDIGIIKFEFVPKPNFFPKIQKVELKNLLERRRQSFQICMSIVQFLIVSFLPMLPSVDMVPLSKSRFCVLYNCRMQISLWNFYRDDFEICGSSPELAEISWTHLFDLKVLERWITPSIFIHGNSQCPSPFISIKGSFLYHRYTS